jgi:hypothetical protein
VYEVRFKGRWSGSIAHALADLEMADDGCDTTISVVDGPALVALVNRASELGLVIEGVTRTDGDAGDTTV